MTKNDFEKAVLMAKEAGFELIDDQYYGEDFGSWYISLDTKPVRRLMWDGEEECLIVETELSPDNWVYKWSSFDAEGEYFTTGVALWLKPTS